MPAKKQTSEMQPQKPQNESQNYNQTWTQKIFNSFSTTAFSIFLVLMLMFVSFWAGAVSARLQNYQGGTSKGLLGLILGNPSSTTGTTGTNPSTNPAAAPAPAPLAAPTQPTTPTVNPNLEGVRENDHIRGNPNAKVALIEYSDLECPFCQRFHPTAQQIIDDYGGDVMWVYRHFPLDQIHPTARKLASASECANNLGGNDAFWAYVDKVYENQPGLTQDTETLAGLATEIGLNSAAFSSCLDSGEMADIVEADYQSGVKAGVRGTPGNILLNTENNESLLISGAQPLANFTVVIDPMLDK